jgi:hypothetical protein
MMTGVTEVCLPECYPIPNSLLIVGPLGTGVVSHDC